MGPYGKCILNYLYLKSLNHLTTNWSFTIYQMPFFFVDWKFKMVVCRTRLEHLFQLNTDLEYDISFNIYFEAQFPLITDSVLDTTLCDKVCQWLATDRWFSLGTLVSSTNNTDSDDKTEILLKVALNTINQTTDSLQDTVSHFTL